MWEAHLSADPGTVPFLGLRKNYRGKIATNHRGLREPCLEVFSNPNDIK